MAPAGLSSILVKKDLPAIWRRVLPRAPVFDVLLVLVLLALAEQEIWHPVITHPRVGPLPLAVAATTATSLALLWRRQASLAVLLIIALVTVIRAFAGGGVAGWGFFAPFMVAVYSVARYRADAPWYWAAAATLLLTFSATLIDGVLETTQGTSPGFVLFAYAVLLILWILGSLIRSRDRLALQLEDRASLLERDRDQKARDAVAEERARIARELHDVVAHSVSVLIVQVHAAEALLEREPEKARAYLRKIDTSARDALAEMRRLVGILDTGSSGEVLDPQPGLANLAELANEISESGLPVHVEIRGRSQPLPPGVDLAAFRIVQEALTNALRHAKASQARVMVSYSTAGLALEIADDGIGGVPPRKGSGHGLIGMEQRAVLYGGRLSYGPRSGGGFVVQTEIPLDGVTP